MCALVRTSSHEIPLHSPSPSHTSFQLPTKERKLHPIIRPPPLFCFCCVCAVVLFTQHDDDDDPTMTTTATTTNVRRRRRRRRRRCCVDVKANGERRTATEIHIYADFISTKWYHFLHSLPYPVYRNSIVHSTVNTKVLGNLGLIQCSALGRCISMPVLRILSTEISTAFIPLKHRMV